jgi:hypothetical protein
MDVGHFDHRRSCGLTVSERPAEVSPSLVVEINWAMIQGLQHLERHEICAAQRS